jgi:hypothetical protein
MKTASAEPAQPAIELVALEVDREGVKSGLPAREREISVEPPVKPASAKPAVEPLSEKQSDAANRTDLEMPGQPKDDLVQKLVESFKTASKKQDNKYADVIATWNEHSSGWNISTDFFPTWGYWRWVVVGVVAGVLVLLAIGVPAHRLPWRKATSVSVSKAGQSPSAAAPDSQNPAAENSSSAGDSGNATGNEIRSDQSGSVQDKGGNANATPNSVTSAPSLPPGLASALSNAGQSPCINLGPRSGKIRIYFWTEKNTPEAIAATYAKNLRAVQDVQLVDKVPYDLVLYVNGARVNGSGAEAGFMWSSRLFHPWYCGQSVGLLEQPEVNESLHYAQGANLDQRIQAEVAYLILHTFESIRNEHQKQP